MKSECDDSDVVKNKDEFCCCCLKSAKGKNCLRLNGKKCLATKTGEKIQNLFGLTDSSNRKKYLNLTLKNALICRGCLIKLDKFEEFKSSLRLSTDKFIGDGRYHDAKRVAPNLAGGNKDDNYTNIKCVNIRAKYSNLHSKGFESEDIVHTSQIKPSNEELLKSFFHITSKLFGKKLYSDIDVYLESGHAIHGHKIILSVHSLDWGIDGFDNSHELYLTDVKSDVGYAILKWIYTDKLDIDKMSDSDLLELFGACSRYKLSILFKRTEKVLRCRLKEDNVELFYNFAVDNKFDKLLNYCKAFKQTHDTSTENNQDIKVEPDSDEESQDSLSITNQPLGDHSSIVDSKRQIRIVLNKIDSSQLSSENGGKSKGSKSVKKDLRDSDVSIKQENESVVEEENNDNSDSLEFENDEDDDDNPLDDIVDNIDDVDVDDDDDDDESYTDKNDNEYSPSGQLHKKVQNVKSKITVYSNDAQENSKADATDEHGYSQEVGELQKLNIKDVERELKAKDPKIDLRTFGEIIEQHCSICPGLNPYKCKLCGRAYDRKRDFQNHMIEHFGEKPFRCDYCPNEFKTKTLLETHEREHTGQSRFMCHICGKALKDQRSLERHVDIHGDRISIQCEVCGKYYATEVSLKKHQLYHLEDKDKPFQCRICGKAYIDRTYFKIHERSHTGEKPYQCSKCGKAFSHIGTLRKHNRSHAKAFNCGVCGMSFNKRRKLHSHIQLHDENVTNEAPPYVTCDQCPEIFYSKVSLDYHKTLKHPQLKHLEEYFDLSEDKTKYTCKICQTECTEATEIKLHLASHPQVEPFKCNICPKRFRNRTGLSQHRLTHIREKSFKCEHCNQSFSKLFILKQHEKRHTGESHLYKCQLCNNPFRCKRQFVRHILKHKENEDYMKTEYLSVINKSCEEMKKYIELNVKKAEVMCDICGKIFYQNENLKNHMQTHTTDRNFECDVCGKTYKSKKDVQVHKYSHTANKQFKCQQCSYSSHLAVALKRHMRSHSDLRPHQCEQCGKSFKDKFTLSDHIRFHKGDKRFKCDLCDRAFVVKSALTCHRRTHTGEKPYQCVVCLKAFSDNRSKKKHELTHAVNENPQPTEQLYIPPIPPITDQPVVEMNPTYYRYDAVQQVFP